MCVCIWVENWHREWHRCFQVSSLVIVERPRLIGWDYPGHCLAADDSTMLRSSGCQRCGPATHLPALGLATAHLTEVLFILQGMDRMDTVWVTVDSLASRPGTLPSLPSRTRESQLVCEAIQLAAASPVPRGWLLQLKQVLLKRLPTVLLYLPASLHLCCLPACLVLCAVVGIYPC